MMAIEQYTESLTMSEMKCKIGKNDFGYVYPQGDIPDFDKIEKLLKVAGGKPKISSPYTFENDLGTGKAKPEYIITFDKDLSTIIVVECKKSVKFHESENFVHPADYAVDGALYYAKYLKSEYNIIAIGISGTSKENMKASAYYWPQNQEEFYELKKARDIILEPENYIKLVNGEKLQKEYSLEDIRNTALEMHDTLREIKVSEKHKPIFIAGILIALENQDFSEEYSNYRSFDSVMNGLNHAIENTLNNSDIKKDKIDNIKNAFSIIGSNEKLKAIPLGHKNSITWYIEQLEMKIKPMMNYADASIDALGVFYHEFVKYSGGDGKGLGIVLTPQHLTEFMCELAGVNKNSRVVDICCGSGSFLVTAMTKMFKNANQEEIIKIKKEGLYGVELDVELFTLAIANMIIRRDGKSNIYHGDCFNKDIKNELKNKNVNIGLINPPYSQDDVCELEFVENMLEILVPGGTGVAVVPMSCAIGTKFKEVRERILKKNKLKAVFSMPDDIFYPTGTNTCVMLWEAHTPHDSTEETFFGCFTNDGFVKRKKLGRVDAYNKWDKILKDWLSLYKNRVVKPGITAKRSITHNDEWLCEAYMETDYTTLCEDDFKESIKKYLSYLVLEGKANLDNISSRRLNIPKLDFSTWKEFNIIEIWDNVDRGKRLKSEDREPGNISYFSASEFNNGLTDKISNPLFTFENSLIYTTFGDCFYIEDIFTASDEITIFRSSNLNKYNGLFISTVIQKNKYKYRFGRKAFRNKFENDSILLPVNSKGNIDWDFMENYIKALPYSEKI